MNSFKLVLGIFCKQHSRFHQNNRILFSQENFQIMPYLLPELACLPILGHMQNHGFGSEKGKYSTSDPYA